MLDDDAKTESLAYAVNCDRKCLDLLSYVAKLDAAIRLLIAIIDDPSITRRAEKAIDQLQCDVIHAKRLIDKRIERIANPLQLRNERQLELQL